jgi:hypothetical protein
MCEMIPISCSDVSFGLHKKLADLDMTILARVVQWGIIATEYMESKCFFENKI